MLEDERAAEGRGKRPRRSADCPGVRVALSPFFLRRGHQQLPATRWMDSSDERPAQTSRQHRSSLPNSRLQLSRHDHRRLDDDEFEREVEEERELRRQRRIRRDSQRRAGLTGRDEAVEQWREGRGAVHGARRGSDEVGDESEDTEGEDESDSETGEGSSLLGSSRGRGRRRARDDDLELGESAPPSRRWDNRVISPGERVVRNGPSPAR